MTDQTFADLTKNMHPDDIRDMLSICHRGTDDDAIFAYCTGYIAGQVRQLKQTTDDDARRNVGNKVSPAGGGAAGVEKKRKQGYVSRRYRSGED